MAVHAPRWSFNLSMARLAPRLPGVYALWFGEHLVYLGSTRQGTTLRQCLVEHVRKKDPGPPATHFSWEACTDTQVGEAEALARLWFGARPRKRAAPSQS